MTDNPSFKFVVDGEPVPAPRPRTVTKGGKTWTYAGNPQYRAWCKAIKKACPESHHYDQAQVRAYFVTDKVHDVDNLAKGILDALTGILWDNDKVVWDLHLMRLETPEGATAYTTIEIIGEEPRHTQSRLLSEMIQ